MRRLRRLTPRSVRARAALAAALVGVVLFLTGAAWTKHLVSAERVQYSRIQAAETAEQGSQAVVSDNELFLGSALCFKSGEDWQIMFSDQINDRANPDKVAFELVGPDNTVLLSSDSLKPFEQRGPILPRRSQPEPQREPARPNGLFAAHGTPLTLGSAKGSRLANRTVEVYSATVPYIDLRRPPWPCADGAGWPDSATTARLHVFVLPFDADAAVTAVDRVLLPTVPAAVALIALAAWLATTHALRPVDRMRAQAEQITSNNLKQRLPVPTSGDQLTRLATTLNDTLDRLARSADCQRQFIADAAHELRSPISSLRVMLDTATTGNPVINEAAAEARRLHRLTEDLLLLAKLDSAQPIVPQPVDLAALAANQVADRGRIGPVRFTLHTSGEAVVNGDAAQLGRLLTNLLDNAERHASSAVTTTITADTDTIRLGVADDGPGVPIEHRARIFDRFTRLDESRDRSHGGTGLGLAIARDICIRHGGTLTLDETDGGGAYFVARLPAAR